VNNNTANKAYGKRVLESDYKLIRFNLQQRVIAKPTPHPSHCFSITPVSISWWYS